MNNVAGMDSGKKKTFCVKLEELPIKQYLQESSSSNKSQQHDLTLRTK